MPSALFDLTGKVVLVTGSSKGLGRAMATALAEAGAKVCMNYYNDPAAAEVALEDMKSRGGQGIMVRASAIDEADIDELVTTCETQLGPIDAVVVNATCDQPHLPIEEYEDAHVATFRLGPMETECPYCHALMFARRCRRPLQPLLR